MKKSLLFAASAAFLSAAAFAQCVTMTPCPSNVNTANDAGQCGAVVTFSTPTATSSCTVNIADTFFYTGAQQTFVVPAGVNILTVETWGAQGGANWVNNVNYGGYVKADIPVTPGETLYIYVGQKPNGIAGGFNGGGNGEGAGQGGGGATDVRQGGTALANRVVVAGGGGGAGYWSSLHVVGGVGGFLNGGNGYRDPNYATNPGGLGASQSAAGANGTCVSLNNPVCAGSFGQGGAPSGCGCEGYGGGGGWYGGAGSGNCRGGGGGSGYLIPAAINITTMDGIRIGNGLCVISVQGNSSPTVTQTAGLASGSLFPVGTTTNTFTADDGFGNTATCSFDVTVNDNESPVITNVPINITQTNDAGQCGAVVNWSGPSILDNCSVTSTSTANSGDFFPVGSTTVTYTATDASNNSATASFTVTVTDNEAPAVVCPADVTVNNDPGQCGATNVVISSPSSTDNCSVASTMSNAPGTYPVGITTITWIVTDVNGNSSTCQQTVTVLDVEPPVFTCTGNISMCPGVLQYQDPTATDNCSAAVTLVSGPASGTVLTAGNYTVVFAAIDPSGNTDTCSFNVTVNANPTVTLSLTTPSTVCFDDANYTLGGGSPAGGTWSGNGVTGSSFDPSAAGNGTQTITYNYTDVNGCMGSATDNIIVSQCTGISEHGDISFNLYPNPATYETSITFESTGSGTLQLFDASGKLVMSEQIVNTKQQINLGNLANGIYSVRFSSANAVASGKLTIQR